MREKVHYGPQKIAFRPFLYLETEGIGVDIVMKGLTFFNVQFGISSISLETRGNCICGADDGEDLRVRRVCTSEISCKIDVDFKYLHDIILN